MVGCAVLAVFGLFLTLVLTHSGPAKPRPAPRPPDNIFSTLVSDEAIKPGNYATAINVHNPSLRETVRLYKRAVPGYPESAPAPGISPTIQTYSLAPGYAVEVDCADIETLLGAYDPTYAFSEGFVTIYATGVLDVVGVYSSEPPEVTGSPLTIPGVALDLQNILPRIETVRPTTNGSSLLPPGRYFGYSAKFLCGKTQAAV
jgi:hypothetical protein